MTWGTDPKRLRVLEKQREKGEPVPALDNRPELLPELMWFWNAFWLLSSARQAGFSACAIPISEIMAWLDLHYVDDLEDRTDLCRIIRMMDVEWLTIARNTVTPSKEKANVSDAK